MHEKEFINEKNEAEAPSFNAQNEQSNSEEEVPMENAKDITTTGNGEAAADMPVISIDIQSIGVEYHPRKHLGKIGDLQASIKRDGLLEPLLVRQVGENKYAVIDGTRRLEAIREFGWLAVPCIVKENMEPSEAAHLSYVKNSERSGFDPIEVALHLKAMQDDFGYSLSELQLMGYGARSHISNNLKLLNLPESIQRLFQKRKITVRHALAILKLGSAKEQERMAKRIVDHELSAKTGERQIARAIVLGDGGAAGETASGGSVAAPIAARLFETYLK